MQQYFIYVVAAAILLALTLFFFRLVAGKNSEDRKTTRKVTVSASGKSSAKPDKADIEIGLHSQPVTQAELAVVQKQQATKFTQIVENIETLAPDAQVETSGFSVRKHYSRIVGEDNTKANDQEKFVVHNAINVTLESPNLDKVGSIIDSAVKEGSNDVSNVHYYLSDDATQSASFKAQRNALKFAREKAENIADTVDADLGKVLLVSENGARMSRHFNESAVMSAQTMSSQKSQSDAMREPELLHVTSDVTVDFELE